MRLRGRWKAQSAVVCALLALALARPAAADCAHAETRTVRGASLGTLAPAGTEITLLVGHYACHYVARGDLVVLRHAENELIKIVKAIPGDRFEVRAYQRAWQLYINGEVARTSRGEPYVLDLAARNMLALYERDYHGAIPDKTVLVLGDLPEPTVDSRRFGLLSLGDVVGKALVK